MPETPAKPRYQSEHTGSSIRFTIPSKKNWFLILFLGFWLCGWAVGEIAVLGTIGSEIIQIISGQETTGEFIVSLAGSGFLLIWVTVWTVGGAYAIYTWLWNISGKEILEISATSISITYKVGSFGKPKEYLQEHVKDLRSTPIPSEGLWGISRRKNLWGRGPGSIAFDYGAKTINAGTSCDEAEAKMILSELYTAYPHYKPN